MSNQSNLKSQFAFWLQSDSQAACEIGRLAGYDIIIFDVEHGVFPVSSIDRLVPFCNSIGLTPFVRVNESTQPNVQAALDIGARGVILPQVRDFAHAQSVSTFAKFPPRGQRGVGFSRTMKFAGATDAFIEEEDQTRVCYVMIETSGAFRDASEIASLQCVDGLFIGPSDLSLARGRGVFKGSEIDLSDLHTVASAAKDAGKLFAAATPSASYCREAIRLGASFVGVADELSAMLLGFTTLKSEST